ncbi:MAG: hypothetical protein SF052_17515 [Bacteroidia bacterium]|nr:hypothetical protein [Bacteroidia bacterium]
MRVFFFLTLIGVSVMGCTGSKNLRDNGLSYLKLGDPMPREGTVLLKGHSVRDTMFHEQDFIWRASVIKYGKGRVYVEDDFLQTGKVNRIRIQTPELRAQKLIHVGMTFGDLQAMDETWDIAWLEDYQLLDIISIDHPSVHYLIREKEKPAVYFNKTPILKTDISPASTIVAIVIM